ncbi:MAG: Calvin cycle protein CP12 [Stenomitos rutilans HA7619-LM2]|nr:Calvin cycle protein CP12 [Stenomitos rutilans HA7619-LM2]
MSKLLNDTLENGTTSLEEQLPSMLEQARAACSTNGDLSSECAAAWDAVEEVQAASADRRLQQKTSLDRYCDERPDAVECRIYDV